MKPIEGPRFHCQVCADFDFCKECFLRGQSHDHAFERSDDHGQPAVYVGSPKTCRLAIKQKKKVHIYELYKKDLLISQHCNKCVVIPQLFILFPGRRC